MLTLKIKAPANSVFLCTTAAVADTSNLPLAWFQGQTFRGGRPRGPRGVQAARWGASGRGLSTLALSFGEGLWSPAAWRGNRTTDSTGPGGRKWSQMSETLLGRRFSLTSTGKKRTSFRGEHVDIQLNILILLCIR